MINQRNSEKKNDKSEKLREKKNDKSEKPQKKVESAAERWMIQDDRE